MMLDKRFRSYERSAFDIPLHLLLKLMSYDSRLLLHKSLVCDKMFLLAFISLFEGLQDAQCLKAL